MSKKKLNDKKQILQISNVDYKLSQNFGQTLFKLKKRNVLPKKPEF